MKIRCLLLATLWVLVSGTPVRAIHPTQPASSFLRTHFTNEEGLPGTVAGQIGQTKDGFLWLIIDSSTLTRFDGKNFYPFATPSPVTLAVAPDGDLWVGTNEELIRIPSFSLNQFKLSGLISYHPRPDRASKITFLRFGQGGVLWGGTAHGLFRYDGDQFVALGPRVSTRHVEEAPDGHLLLTTDEGLTELDGSEVVPRPNLAQRLGVKDNEILAVLKDTHGNTWYCTAMGVARETGGRIEKLGTYARISRSAPLAREDAQGNVWIGEEGLFRGTSEGLELVAAGIQVRELYIDHDGSLWVSTNGDGVYRFKDRAARMYTTEDGLPSDVIMTVIAAQDGSVWTGANCGGISRFDGAGFQTYNEKKGLLNSCVFALVEDANRDPWVGTWGGGAFKYHDGKFTQYSKSQGMADDIVVSIVAARDGAIWFGTKGGLSRLKDGQLRNFTTADGLSRNVITRVFEDSAGVIWGGSRQGLDRLVGHDFEHFASLPRTSVIPFREDREGGFFVNVDVDASSIIRRLDKDRTYAINDLAAVNICE